MVISDLIVKLHDFAYLKQIFLHMAHIKLFLLVGIVLICSWVLTVKIMALVLLKNKSARKFLHAYVTQIFHDFEAQTIPFIYLFIPILSSKSQEMGAIEYQQWIIKIKRREMST